MILTGQATSFIQTEHTVHGTVRPNVRRSSYPFTQPLASSGIVHDRTPAKSERVVID
jgi:hypothetical protein